MYGSQPGYAVIKRIVTNLIDKHPVETDKAIEPQKIERQVLSEQEYRCHRKMCLQEYVSGGHIGLGYSVLLDKFT